jgi:hypothetical protein
LNTIHNFAGVVGIITTRMREKLRELNALPNKCSHNWFIHLPVRRKRQPHQPKPLLLNVRGRDLYKIEALKQFMREFGHMYYLIYGAVTREERRAAIC